MAVSLIIPRVTDNTNPIEQERDLNDGLAPSTTTNVIHWGIVSSKNLRDRNAIR